MSARVDLEDGTVEAHLLRTISKSSFDADDEDPSSPQDEQLSRHLLSGSSHASEPTVPVYLPGTITSRTLEDTLLPSTAVHGHTLSFSSCLMILLSAVLGSGIFAVPGSIARSTNSVGLSLLLWVSGALIASAEVMIAMEYGCLLPRSGGDKVYLEFTYRWPRFLTSTMIAMHAMLLGFGGSNCVIFGEYVLFAAGMQPTELKQKALALALLTGVTVMHGAFLKTGIKVQNAFGWVKMGMICFMTLLGLWVAFVGVEATGHKPDAGTIGHMTWSGLWEGSNWQWGSLSTAIFKVNFVYNGLANLGRVLDEVKDPVRTMKKAAPTALAIVSVLYFVANMAYFSVVPFAEIKGSGEFVAALFFRRIFGETVGKVILPLCVAISAAGSVMVVIFTMARINQEIARQGLLPFSRFLSSSKPFNSPLGGLMVLYVPSFLIIVIPPHRDVFNFILDIEQYTAQFGHLAIALGLLWLRVKQPELKRPFKAWLPAVWFRVMMCIALLLAPFFPPGEGEADVGFWYATYAVVATGILALSVLYWYVMFVALPRVYDYGIEEEVELLDDGTSITNLIKVKRL